MNIGISGNARQSAVAMLEEKHGVKSISLSQGLLEAAQETFNHFDEKLAIFDGTVLDIPVDADMQDIEEQVKISALTNLDKVFVLSDGTDKEATAYAELFPEKVVFVQSAEEIEF